MERVFKICDKDGDLKISLEDFLDTMYGIAGTDETNKLVFLFNLYDINGK